MIAQEVCLHSGGLFNRGIGHRLEAAGLLPRHFDRTDPFGSIEYVQFLEPTLVQSDIPLCLDL
jgi:thiamine biosynthesis lipoprotein